MARSPRTRLAIGWLTVFVVGTDLFVVSPLLPLIATEYRMSATRAGLCVTLFSLSYAIVAPFLGRLADRIGRSRILTICLAGFAAANLATGFAPSFLWLLLARLFAGVAAAGVAPAVYALVGASAPPQRRATWLSLVVSGLLMSLMVGAPLAALAGAAFGLPCAFSGLGLASLALIWANRAVWPAERPVVPAAGWSDPPLAGRIAARLAPMVAWSTALYGMYTYLGTGLCAEGFSAAQIVRVLVFYGAGAIAGLLFGGRLADRLGTKLTAGISLSGLCIAFLSLRSAIDPGVPASVAFALTSAVAQMFFPAQQAGLVTDFPAYRTTVLAWNNSMLFFGISLGSLIGGVAVARGGFAADLTISAVIALIGAALNSILVPGPADPHGAPAPIGTVGLPSGGRADCGERDR
jgi:MFS transporter, DHA1 family, putative efflux transporter